MTSHGLFAGGAFTGIFDDRGLAGVSNVARWDGNRWQAIGVGVGAGVNGPIYALAVIGNDVYAGGAFQQAGGEFAQGIARWNGSRWFALKDASGNDLAGSAFSPAVVLALASVDNQLYVAGFFGRAGGVQANNIARWNGQQWSILPGASGTGTNGVVYSLLATTEGIFAGGTFTSAGGQPANNIARWQSGDWSALGSGILGTSASTTYVSAIARNGSGIFVAGEFTRAGGTLTDRVARWNGDWSALGSGLNGPGYALATIGDDLGRLSGISDHRAGARTAPA